MPQDTANNDDDDEDDEDDTEDHHYVEGPVYLDVCDWKGYEIFSDLTSGFTSYLLDVYL